VPPIQQLPRPGWFGIPPSGPGFYTLIDALDGVERQSPPKYPYRQSLLINSFFDIDWKYLDDPKNTDFDYADFLKRIRCGPDDLFLLTLGGEFRGRYTYEENSRLLANGPIRNQGADNAYDLYRTRVYADLFLTERFRIFAEFISALSPNTHLPPLVIDRNKADFLNLFVDANLFDICDQPVWFRVGRQELLYGSQRLVSPLEWANTRRTFQGAKLFWRSQQDDLDLFLVQPVVPNDDRFDSVDNNQVFAGLWYTHRPNASSTIDAYYLMLDNTNPAFVGRGGVRGGITVHTLGSRYVGVQDNWLWDVEGMLQFGDYVNQNLLAGNMTVGGGYHFKECAMTPQFWLYYDWASGDRTPGAGGTNATFQQLFPFGHYYMGWLDLVGRKNIHDISSIVSFWPSNWILGQVQLHNFFLDSRQDALYNAGGVPIRQDATGRAGNYVGTELDFIFNFHLTNHSDILIAYSYMFAGEFIRNTATTRSGRRDPQAIYLQYSYKW
jgi:hypothetical protein